jgi:hypothetical protein
MAVITNTTSGNWNSAATWAVVQQTTWSAPRATQENNGLGSTTSFVGGTGQVITAATTIDAIMLKLQVRSATLGGTLSVRLFNVTAAAPVAGTTVTININDMPSPATVGTWMTFKFPSPITTVANNAYRVELSTSVAASATFFRRSASAGDWTFGLRTTTQQLPAAGDQVVIGGDYTGAGAANSYTVTMNQTGGVTIGTVPGQSALEVSSRGALDWGVAASSNYPMTLNGDLVVNQDGAVSIGTLASPMPSTSTAVLSLNVASNVAYGILIRGNGSFTTYGASKTTKAYLNSTANVGATSITTSVATGWESGDILAIASTSRLVAECEQVTMSGAASGTSVPISALAALHEGSALSNVAKAEIINLKRNVTIRGVSISLQTYFLATQAAQVTCGYTEFQYLGSGTAGARGVEIQATAGSQAFTGCSFRNFEASLSTGFFANTVTPNINVQDCVFYRMASTSVTTIANTTSTITFNECWSIGGTSMNAAGSYVIPSNLGTFTNLNAAGSTFVTYGIGFTGSFIQTPYTVNNIVSHTHVGSAVAISTSSEQTNTAAVFSNIVTYRSAAEGVFFSTTQNVFMDTLYSFGNATRGITYSLAFDVRIKNINLWSEASYIQTAGIVYANHADNLFIENGNIGVAGAHSTADINDVCPRNQHNAVIKNVTFGSPTLSAGQANYTVKTYTGIARLNGVAGSHRTYYKYGILSSDSTFFQTLSPSVRMAPNSATQKFRGPTKVAAVASGKSLKMSVWVRKSVIGDGTTYNGNEAQLIVLSNTAAGIADDTVIATTTTASNGAFELITGTTAAVTDNTALEFLIACDGTLGWINVDRWMVEVV